MGLLGFAIVAATWGAYWPRIARHTVPRRPRVHQAAMVAGVALAAAAIARSPGPIGWIFVLAALVGAGFFLFTTTASRLPARGPAAQVGRRYLDFTAKDWQERDFQLAGLDGRRFILKFYRGHW
jgi:hypothetical protein